MDEKFNDFQLEEYKNISNAHFETNKQIGIFFRYFLLIASAPALIFLWFGKDNPNFIDNILKGNEEVLNINLFTAIFIIFISIVNMLSSFYLVGLRLDNVLYARTINGVRRYFYNNVKINEEEQYRVLPKQINIPKYFDNHTFGILFYAIALINSAYFTLGIRIIAGVGEFVFHTFLIPDYDFMYSIIMFIILLGVHVSYYYIAARYRRILYLKSRIIGIDIDGVLNNHRMSFCDNFHRNLSSIYPNGIPINKKLIPEEINKLPVSSIEGKVITLDEEFDVFNNPEYWQKQQLIEDNVGNIIKELKNRFGYIIKIHTYRPWPDYSCGKIIRKENDLWKKTSLNKITKSWLLKNGIVYNRLFIEKNQVINRFYHTSKNSYRYFIEDDINNAIKLSFNCEYIFLIDQPYNQRDKLPANIIRVKGWNEIKSEIKNRG